MKFGFRYHNPIAARIVCEVANRLASSFKLHVDKQPNTETREDKAGDYVIEADRDMSYPEGGKVGQCLDQALVLALADELRNNDPHNPLLTIWHLRPENRDKLMRF